jgi:uncharacterized protein (TIGR00369 family)
MTVDRSALTTLDGLQAALDIAPFHRWLGLELVSVSDSGIVIALPWRDELVSNPAVGAAHGGVLASVIDLGGLYAVLAAGGSAQATADLRVDYHRPALAGRILARSRVVKLGKRLSVADTVVENEAGEMLASGRGAYLAA